MKSPLLYLLEVLFCSGLLLAFYRLVLCRKVAFVLCRRYLVAAAVLSVAIPALDIPLYPARPVVYPVALIAVAPAPAAPPVADRTETFRSANPQEPAAAPVDWLRIARRAAGGLYGLTTAVLLGALVVRIVRIRRLRRRARLTDCGQYVLAEHPAVDAPFSFLRTVFVGPGLEGRCREIVLCHEASHVRHRHSAERIAVEVIRCLFWFNPFVWITARALAEVQEWEADRDVLLEGYDLTEYRTVLFRQLFGYNPDIASGLNHSFTKNRFAMMTQFRKRRFALVRFGAVVPVVAGMMLLCSFTVRNPDTTRQTPAAEDARRSEVDLAGLKPVEVLYLTVSQKMPDEKGKGAAFGEVCYLPRDDAKYLRDMDYEGIRITDPKGTDITWWADKHYAKHATNPRFLVDGVLLTKEEYLDRYYDKETVDRLENHRTVIYDGVEVGERLGDPAIDALVVFTRPVSGNAAQEVADGNLFRVLGRYKVHDEGGPRIVARTDSTITIAGARLRTTYESKGSEWTLRCDTLHYDFATETLSCSGHVEGTGEEGHFISSGFRLRIDSQEYTSKVYENGIASSNNVAFIGLKDGEIRLNNEPVEMDELEARLDDWREEQLGGDAKAAVWIQAPSATSMETLSAIKDRLRAAGVLQVMYSCTDPDVQGRPLTRMLAPIPGEEAFETNGVKVLPSGDVAIKERNAFFVEVGASGTIRAGMRGRLSQMSPGELTEAIKEFVLNPTDDTDLPEKVTTAFERPDGSELLYPVSNATVILMPSRSMDFGSYYAIQEAIGSAFEAIRTDLWKTEAPVWGLTEEWQNLSPEERKTGEALWDVILRAVPLRVSEAESR